jgi:AcrR family transcriptional regulator
MTDRATAVDRAGAVRRAMCTLVARHGFHGASMSAVANEAGVATGTARALRAEGTPQAGDIFGDQA